MDKLNLALENYINGNISDFKTEVKGFTCEEIFELEQMFVYNQLDFEVNWKEEHPEDTRAENDLQAQVTHRFWKLIITALKNE